MAPRRGRSDLDLATWNALKGAAWPIFEKVGDLARAAGASPPQISLLHVLASRHTPATPLEVARILGVTPGTVTATLDKLEARSLLERARGEREDGRVVTLRITAKGRALVERWHDACRAEFARAFAALDDEGSRDLQRLLEKIAPALDGVPPGIAAREDRA